MANFFRSSALNTSESAVLLMSEAWSLVGAAPLAGDDAVERSAGGRARHDVDALDLADRLHHPDRPSLDLRLLGLAQRVDRQPADVGLDRRLLDDSPEPVVSRQQVEGGADPSALRRQLVPRPPVIPDEIAHRSLCPVGRPLVVGEGSRSLEERRGLLKNAFRVMVPVARGAGADQGHVDDVTSAVAGGLVLRDFDLEDLGVDELLFVWRH